jgi:hypothetical protein
MAEITDDMMQATLPTARPYTVLILKVGPNRQMPDVDAVVWEHGSDM